MSSESASTAYFLVDRLKSAFAANIEQALREGRIADGQYRQLKQLHAVADTDDFTGCGLRVDRVITEDGSPLSDELAGALLISHTRGDTPLYLDTLLHGLERFDDRQSLLQALQRYTLGETAPAFEYQVLDGQLFRQRMQVIVDQQVTHLRQLASRLLRMPSLDAALLRALGQCFQSLSPDTRLDLTLPLVQVFRSDNNNASVSVYNQTLTQAAMEVLVGQPLPAHHVRTYLNGRGQALDATQSRHYETLLAEAVKGLVPVYESLLGDYWQRAGAHGQTPRTLMAQALRSGFRQALLQARDNGLFQPDEFARLLTLLVPASTRHKTSLESRRLALVIGHQEPVKLAGMFLITGGPLPDLILYSARQGLRRFASLQALADHFATAGGRGEVRFHVSLNDQALLDGSGSRRIDAYAIEHPLFIDCVDSIIGLQKRNLAYVLGCDFADVPSACAMINDALDVSYLIDRRLAWFDGGGRWGSADVPFAERWFAPSATANRDQAFSPESATGDATALHAWTEQLARLDGQVQWLDRLQPDIEADARRLLNEYLAVFADTELDALSVSVICGDDTPADNEVSTPLASVQARPVRLIDLLLEKYSGYRPAAIARDAAVVRLSGAGVPPQPLPLLTVEFINGMLERLAPHLGAACLNHVQGFQAQPLRLAHQQVFPAMVVNDFFEDALRLECELLALFRNIEQKYTQMFEQVLDRPVRSLRDSLDDDPVEVYSAALEYGNGRAAAPLSQFFIVQRPLHPHDKVMAWSALAGLELFDSLTVLGEQLNERLSGSSTREPWLRLFSEPQRTQVRQHLEQPAATALMVQLKRIDGHFIQVLQAREQHRQRSNVEQALQDARHGAMSAEVMLRLTSVAGSDQLMSSVLDGLYCDVQAAFVQSAMPPWLLEASHNDLGRYVELLKRYYLVNDPADDFLATIPSLPAFARQQLIRRLNADYPGQFPDPAQITVTSTAYVPTPVTLGDSPSSLAAATVVKRENLTAYALNHFSRVQGALLSVELPDKLPIPSFIAPNYFQSLVRSLDIGQQYRDLLKARFAENSQDYTLSRTRFMTQIPSRMLLVGLEMKLQHQLSATAYGYLQSVLDMPDSLARQLDDAHDVTLRPLQLLAAADMTPDPVAGVYLIGPRDTGKGPIIVHALFNKAFTFKEYPDEAQLLRDLQTPGSLQTLVLGRVDPAVRRRYDHGGLREPHIPWSSEGFMDGPGAAPGPVTLADAPVSGNVLQFLFVETLQVLKDLCRKQTVTTAEADWQSLVYLMGLGAEQVLSFLPGKLGLLLAAWQGQGLFRASAASAWDRHWGRALSEITAALGTLLAHRRSARLQWFNAAEPGKAQVASAGEHSQFSWSNSNLTPQLKARLRALQVHDIALSELQHDSQTHLYTDPKTRKHYAAVAGQVFEVTSSEAQWRIVGPEGQGPRIRLNAARQWEVRQGLLGGGAQVTRFQAQASSASVDRILIVEAQGMSEIRMAYPDRAALIIEATVQARRSLENCLYNLVPDRPGGSIHGHTTHLINEFFGLSRLSRALRERIRQKAIKLYLALTDPSLSSLTSSRFVVGTNKPGHETTAAFVSMSDAQRRIYLTEGFFVTPDFPLKNKDSRSGSFNVSAHYRSATLIHELSHLVDGTHDIAYLDASTPFTDLLDIDLPELKDFRDELHEHRTTALSHRTPVHRLFRKKERNGWRDITDEEGSHSVLRITGTSTLDMARAVFLADPVKRSEVILSNADSLTMLVMELGRERLAPNFSFNESITSSN